MSKKIENGTCSAKHTAYQPTDAEWKCLSCGAGVQDGEGFIVDEPAEGASPTCELFHDDDYLVCYSCREGISGKAFAARLQKAHKLVVCPCCKGKGLVPAKKA